MSDEYMTVSETSPFIEVTEFGDDEAHAVRLFFMLDKQPYEAVGTAKKHPKDPPNRGVAVTIAMARALRKLADQFEHKHQELVDLNCGPWFVNLDLSDGDLLISDLPLSVSPLEINPERDFDYHLNLSSFLDSDMAGRLTDLDDHWQ